MFRILIIDDHEIVRSGIKAMFSEPAGVAMFGEASEAREALDRIREANWDVAVLDISLGDRSGLDLLRDIKQFRPKLPVLILSMHAEEHYAIRSLKAGAAGYITKGSPREELRSAILTVIKGGHYVTPSITEKMVVNLSAKEGPRHASLSDREFEVMCHIASGKTVGEIAVLMGLSDKTVSTYRRRILDKMGMTTNAELTHYAIREKIVD